MCKFGKYQFIVQDSMKKSTKEICTVCYKQDAASKKGTLNTQKNYTPSLKQTTHAETKTVTWKFYTYTCLLYTSRCV